MAFASTEPTASVTSRELPPDFVLGAATSSYQIEGAVYAGGRGEAIWDRFATVPGATADAASGMDACDHYHRMDEDLDLLAELGADVYGFSIAWPRIQPDGVGKGKPDGLAFYDRLVDGLLERGIEPYATLYHWDLPQTLEDRYDGWRGRDTAGRFADYATIMGNALGDRVTRWATVHDPASVAWSGYERGTHAPGVRDAGGSIRAAHHLLTGHGMATQALVAAGATGVGITLRLADARPASDASGDIAAAELADAMQNRFWLGALAHDVPDDVVELFSSVVNLEELSRPGDDVLASQPLDWLGVDYDGPALVRAGQRRSGADAEADAAASAARRPAGPGLDGIELVGPGPGDPGTMHGSRIDANGLATVLAQATAMLPDTPIVVTGSGTSAPDVLDARGAVEDWHRIAYLTDHLAATLTARADGVPVAGYLTRSLLDGFEWADGYGPRRGLVHVDHETQRRTTKASYRWMQQLLRGR